MAAIAKSSNTMYMVTNSTSPEALSIMLKFGIWHQWDLAIQNCKKQKGHDGPGSLT